jgi:hypothetical protein
MVCTCCGAEVNAACSCGVAYVPKSVRAAEAVKANPEKSNRAIAEEIGVDHKTVGKARAGLEDVGTIPHVETRTDSIGRQQPATKKPTAADQMRVPKTSADSVWNKAWEAAGRLNEIVRLMEKKGQTEFGNKMLDTYPWLGRINF